MEQKNKPVNLVLGGGGVKGIAYIGVFEALEKRNIKYCNIAGVSAGALSGALAGAGYNAKQLWKIMNDFDLGKVDNENVHKKVPIVTKYIKYMNSSNNIRSAYKKGNDSFYEFMNGKHVSSNRFYQSYSADLSDQRGHILSNIITFGKEGCLFDGDYIEDWVRKVLQKKGIRNFGDLRGGIIDNKNPKGYKVRMTAVDATRGKVIILPDDIKFYGIDPDKLEVAKAVRMSTCVPFAFKPVELKRLEGNKLKTYYIVDGGVFDNFPIWMCDNTKNMLTVGFRFKSKNEKNLLSVDTPLSILKGLISAVHDIGIPKDNTKDKFKFVVDIDTTKVSSLDFNLTSEEKKYLLNAGKSAGLGFAYRPTTIKEPSGCSILGCIQRLLKNK